MLLLIVGTIAITTCEFTSEVKLISFMNKFSPWISMALPPLVMDGDPTPQEV
jgi:hypothetical protein